MAAPGLGALLSARLAGLARLRGFTAFTATVLGENRAALRLMRTHRARRRASSSRPGSTAVYAPLRSETVARVVGVR